MLTPARKANSRWRGSAETSGSIACPSWRIAQAPAKSFEVIRIEDTPSPARAGRLAGSSSFAAGIASTLYRFGPSREDAQWRWITPGSSFAAIAWLLLTWLFGLYVTHFTNYRASYGSLGAVVALLTWMYLSAYAFIFGAELNSEIEHQTAKDSTTGHPRAMGERGAWAADNVAKDDEVQDRPEEQREGEKLTQAQPKVADEKG